MPRRSKVRHLPDPIKLQLEERLIANQFTDYAAITKWLAELGHRVGKSSINRYGQELERKLQAWSNPRQARATALDAAVAKELERTKQARLRESTGVLVLIIDPPSHTSDLFVTSLSPALVRDRVQKALAPKAKR